MKTHIIIKKIFLFTLGIILGISLIGCSSLKKKTSEDSPPALTSDGVAIVPAASQNTPPTGTGETVTVVPTDAAPPPGSVTPVENTPAVSPSSTSTTPQTSIEVGTTRDKNIQSVNCNVPQESSEVQAGYPADNTNMATGGASFEMPANQSDSFDRGLIPDGLNNFSREENVSPAEIVTAGTGSSEGSFQNASLGGTISSETKENVSGADG
ncbi:MAG: hypothetical protein IKW74_03440, partial [Thermoguttaceae bacterium]|nr:hypothetical protein [Thermoguttaceae bacterium]